LIEVTATGTPLGAIQPTGGPGGTVVEVVCSTAVVEVAASADVVEVEDDVDGVVGVGRIASPLHAVAKRITASRPGSLLIGVQLWQR
jgi:hypothetical protein